MKRKLFVCAVVMLALVSQAWAGVQSFGHFRVNVPSGWKGELQGSTLVVKSNNYNASVAVAFSELGMATFTDIVERLYIQMGGEDLAQDEDGDYSFTFTNLAGGKSFAIITTEDEYYMVLSLTGWDIPEVQGDLGTIMDSVDWED